MKEKLLGKLSLWWNGLQPKQRKTVVLIGVCAGAFIIALLGWVQSRGKVKEQLAAAKRAETRKDIPIEPGLWKRKKSWTAKRKFNGLKTRSKL
ncbi:hypothetical protein A2G06_16605 (plasmid) [Geobacter anodireducens]|nr:hypothetical protein A2G06_16605 [Geobacter anodireducens]